MCYTCPCGLPFESHGDPRNVVESAFAKAGRTKEIKSAGKTEAKRNMYKLLKKQLDRGELARPRKSHAKKAKAAS